MTQFKDEREREVEMPIMREEWKMKKEECKPYAQSSRVKSEECEQ